MKEKLKTVAMAVGVTALMSASATAAPIQWTIGSGGNDHWYEFIADDLTWQEAFIAAAARTHLGLQGYLATITSADENRFASVSVANGSLAWLGGSDDGDEGNWTWRNGPENGNAFTFVNWNPTEPNNCCGGENYLHTNFDSATGWNDHGGPGNFDHTNGYLVEFSGADVPVPAPATLALFAPALIAVAAARRRRVD